MRTSPRKSLVDLELVQSSPIRSPQRYVTLDGLRGFAAISVALLHFDPILMPGGYLAVDFFFALSGFVLIRTYAPKIEAGLGFVAFMRARLIRLYPLFLCGLVIGLMFTVQGNVRNSDFHLGLSEIAVGTILGVFMLPSPLSYYLFPLNPPFWSLFFEILANIALFLGLARLQRTSLLIVLIGTAAALIGSEYFMLSTDVMENLAKEGVGVGAAGGAWDEWYVGVLRTAFSFTAGVFIGRLERAAGNRSTHALGTIVIALMLVALFAVHVTADMRFAYDLVVVLLALPLLVYLGSRIEPSRHLAATAALIGEVSFALYAVHAPIAHGFQFFARKLNVAAPLLAPVYIGVALAVAWGCVKLIDIPLRRRLTRLTDARWARRDAHGS